MKLLFIFERILDQALRRFGLKVIKFLVVVGICAPLNRGFGQEVGGLEKTYFSKSLTGTSPTLNSNPLVQNASVDLTYNSEFSVTRKIQNIISFGLIEETPNYISGDFGFDVRVKIEYGSSPTSVSELEQTFTIDYKRAQGVNYTPRKYFYFENAEYVKVTVLETSNLPLMGSLNLKDVVNLQNEMRVTRYYELKTGVLPTTLTHVSNQDDVLEVSWAWPADAGNNYTQIEWSWLEDEMKDYYSVNGSLNVSHLFRANATRVDLASPRTSFDIPLIYDGTGKLYYRIRAVNFGSGNRTDGPWSSVQSYSFNGHDSLLNWQATTSYAEEGKHKTMIQYFDGSLRSRQTVTKDNVTKTLVSAETLYDGQGRPAVQILPAPSISNILKYQAGLNLFNGQSQSQDPANFFDLEPIASPGSATPMLSTTSGASKYYSQMNTEVGSSFNKYIPDAEGYPYTVTRYTPDNTGRVMAQSGTGNALKMGSGHESKFHYGGASQEELDGLFGTEVGSYTHYFKNMVIDANGQTSVSYIDMQGRTIATALAGNAPENTVQLDLNNQYSNQGGTSITRNLLSVNSNIVKGNSIESVNSLLVPAATTYNFKYTLTPEVLQMLTCSTGVNACYDCLYDLDISITDESGNNAPILKRFSNISLNSDNTCTTPAPSFIDIDFPLQLASNIRSFSQNLLPGSYSIRKTLLLNDSSLQSQKSAYLANGMCKTEQELIDSVYNVLIGVTDCNNPTSTAITCSSCLVALGDSATYRLNYISSLSAAQVTQSVEKEITASYRAAMLNCDRLCNNKSQILASKRQLMLSDMMPYTGQYARSFDPNLPPQGEAGYSSSLYYKYDIFATGDTATKPFYKKPWNKSEQNDYYYTSLNVIDSSIHPGNYNRLNGLTKDEFQQSFVTSWAESLLPHHPEYKKLLFAENNLGDSYNWMSAFNQIETYSQAEALNYVFTSGSTTKLPYNDPFFAKWNIADMLQNVTQNYREGVSMWQFAYGDVKCKTIMDDALRNSCYLQAPKFPPYSNLTAGEKDQVWKLFRSLYAFERDKYVDQYIAANVSLSDSAQLIDEKYTLRFFADNAQLAKQNNWSWYPSTPNAAPNVNLQDSLNRNNNSRCESYIDTWKQTLLNCPAVAIHPSRDQIISTITTQMAEVCKKGIDASNEYGASSVNPASPFDSTPRNFEDVINNVFVNYNISRTSVCNPYIIEFPKPYGLNPKLHEAVIATIDTCSCSTFTQLKQQASVAGYNASNLNSLNEYFFALYGETMSVGLYNGLQHCNELTLQYVCATQDNYIWVPGGTIDPCGAARPSGTGGQNGGTPVNSSNGDITPDCTVLQNALTNFYAASGSLIDTTSNCQELFVSYFNDTYQTNYTWIQLSEFYTNCGIDQSICSGYERVNCPQDVCSYQYTVYPLPQAQLLPTFLKCGFKPSDRCITCTQIATLTAEFKDIFGSPYDSAPVLIDSNLTAQQIDYNILYAKFLNYRLGLQMTWLDYAQAAEAVNCDIMNYANGGSVLANLAVSLRENGRLLYQASGYIDFNDGFVSEPGADILAEIVGTGGGNSLAVVCRSPKPVSDTAGLFLPSSPCQRVYNMAAAQGQQIYRLRMEDLATGFEAAYRNKCLTVQAMEGFTVTYTTSEYHYTLYYYDMAGNLVKTVPPKGVKPDFSISFLNGIKAARISGTRVVPAHELSTNYRYNGLNEVVAQATPDAGISKFWYDRLGRLVVSQNAQQTKDEKYSYTLYDRLGRIEEVGQKPQTTVISQGISQDTIALNNWMNLTGGTKEQITLTKYDIAEPAIEPLLVQQNLRNRVSFAATKNFSADPTVYTATYYTYDIHGNVDTLLQDYNGVSEMVSSGNQYKRITYDYDLISGKVNAVNYQPRVLNKLTNKWVTNPDAFYHRYKYDGENRLINVETSRDKIVWERDANYSYYKHGPLARTVLGQLGVQGIDYAYTIQGWLKGINNTNLDSTTDMGSDGMPGSVVARDELAFGLHYFDNTSNNWLDYKSVSGGSPFARPGNGSNFISLFNGNIGAISMNNRGLLKGNSSTTNALPLFYNYRYDQLNRLVSMQAYKGLQVVNNLWSPISIDDYKEAITYDPNGNILSYDRNGAPSTGKQTGMDALTYDYYANTNRLRHIGDNQVNISSYSEDIDNQSNADNYIYDAIGNLKTDLSEAISNISWSVYGKISSLSKDGNITTYTYDASGNRLTKTLNGTTNIYVRDSKGNVMSVYEKLGGVAIKQSEIHMYGSKRLGIIKDKSISSSSKTLEESYGTGIVDGYTRNEKEFELFNHLENVLATVSDVKIAIPLPNSPLTNYYVATTLNAQDYFPFGMKMPGRGHSSNLYRYGFNGKENDLETSTQDYGMRIYDPRIGRFMSTDPIARSYPMLTPYQFASNSPIHGIDLDGLEILPVNSSIYRLRYSGTTTALGNVSKNSVVEIIYNNVPSDLKNPSTKSLKWTRGGAVTAYGRDWDVSVDGPIFSASGRYYNKGPEFWGKADAANPSQTNNVKGNYLGNPSSVVTPDGLRGKEYNEISNQNNSKLGALAGVLKHIFGIAGNINNQSIYNASYDEQIARAGFYQATNIVDDYLKRNLIQDKELIKGSGRTDLINFIADGTLPKGSNTEWKLRTFFTGYQILLQRGLDVKPEISVIFDNLNKEYKQNNGNLNFDKIYEFKRSQ